MKLSANLISLVSSFLMIRVVRLRGMPARYRKHGPKSCRTNEKFSPGCTPVPVRLMVNVGPLVIYKHTENVKSNKTLITVKTIYTTRWLYVLGIRGGDG